MAAFLGSFGGFLLCLAILVDHGLCTSFRSVGDVEKGMYQVLDSTPCVRLLNLTGEVGCANPGRNKIVAPLRHVQDITTPMVHPVSVLLPSSELQEFLSRVLREPALADQVAGLLVEFDDRTNINASSGFSADTPFPQAEFSVYDNAYVWNPTGSGFVQNCFGFPTFLLSEESTYLAREVASRNRRSNPSRSVHMAEFDLVMQTTKSGTTTSESCLEEWACLPLGGYSVLSSFPPINMSSDRHIVLAMTSMDSMSLFRDFTLGADSPMSGMISLLTAVDALVRGISLDLMEMQLVFLVLAGEPWGYLGSRRFITELANGGLSVAGLDASRIHQIIEVGSVGRASESGPTTLYAHKRHGLTPGNLSASNAILDALRVSAASSGIFSIQVHEANKSNPGLPPSSLGSFSNKGLPFAGVLLEEYDSVYKNPAYHSHFDTEASINSTAIASSASLLAHTLYILGAGQAFDLASLRTITVNKTLIEEMIDCLLKVDPGMECRLAKGFLVPTQKYPSHYVGVMSGKPSADPVPEFVSDTSRFVWNYLASRALLMRQSEQSMPEEKIQEECSRVCAKPGDVCVGSTIEHSGVCVSSTTRYIPAYSPRLRYERAGWKLVSAEPDDPMSAMDPVWTESFWRKTGLQLYIQESYSFCQLVFLCGLFLTGASVFTITTTKAVLRMRLKYA